MLSAPFTVLCVTAGQEKVVEGPRVCDATGCRVDTCQPEISQLATIDHENVRLEHEHHLLAQLPLHTRLSDLVYGLRRCSLTA